MLIDSIFSVTLCAAGVFFAAHAMACERDDAQACAVAILFACIAYNLAWTPIAPHLALNLKSTQYWAVVDAIIAIYVVERSIAYWWGFPLLVAFCLQLSVHVLKAFDFLAFYPYSVAIDAIGYFQILIFALLGGPGVRNRLFNTGRHGRNALDSYSSTQGAQK